MLDLSMSSSNLSISCCLLMMAHVLHACQVDQFSPSTGQTDRRVTCVSSCGTDLSVLLLLLSLRLLQVRLSTTDAERNTNRLLFHIVTHSVICCHTSARIASIVSAQLTPQLALLCTFCTALVDLSSACLVPFWCWTLLNPLLHSVSVATAAQQERQQDSLQSLQLQLQQTPKQQQQQRQQQQPENAIDVEVELPSPTKSQLLRKRQLLPPALLAAANLAPAAAAAAVNAAHAAASEHQAAARPSKLRRAAATGRCFGAVCGWLFLA
jgi:hypothetical protein